MRFKTTRVLLYFSLFVVIFVLSIASKQINNLVREFRMKGEPNVLLIELLKFIMFSCFGIILGLEGFYNGKSKEGKWKINLKRCLILCIPSFFIGMFYIFFWEFSEIMRWGQYIVWNSLFSYEVLQPMMQILFGYAIITSFYRNDVKRG